MDYSGTPNKVIPSFKKSRLFRSPSSSSTFKSPLSQTLMEIEKGHEKFAADRKKIIEDGIEAMKQRFMNMASDDKLKAIEDASVEDLKISVEAMWKKSKQLQNETDDLEKQGNKIEELKWYIDKMHTYNETKDAAQLVMGRIDLVTIDSRTDFSECSIGNFSTYEFMTSATLEGKTVKKIHEEFGLHQED